MFNFLILIGCVTLSPMASQDLEKVQKKWGSDCANKEGGSQIIFQNGDKRVSLTLDWLTDSQGELTTEFSDPLGRPLGTIIFNRNQIKSTPNTLFKTYPLALDNEGFIWVNDHNTHLKSSELGCLLRGKTPMNWLLDLKGDGTHWMSRAHDEVRKIDFEGRPEEACGAVRGAGIWGWMPGKLYICLGDQGGKLSYSANYFFEWRVLDGENS